MTKLNYPLVTIEGINTRAAKWTVAGWFLGLAYYNWFATEPQHVTLWGHMVLIVGGLFASSIVIGGGMATLAALLTKIFTGSAEGSPHGFAWASFISPILAFFAAKYSLQFASGF